MKTTITIGDRVRVEVGDTTEETMVYFDGEPVGLIKSLYFDLDAQCMKPVLGVTVADMQTIKHDPYFASYMRDIGFEVAILNTEKT